VTRPISALDVPLPRLVRQVAAHRDRQNRLLDAIRTHRGLWHTARVLDLYRLTDPGCVLRATARRDLEALHKAGHLTLVDQPNNRHYTLTRRKEAS